jgi:hypothetical protein
MTDARVEKVYADRLGAGEFLVQADAREATAETIEVARTFING